MKKILASLLLLCGCFGARGQSLTAAQKDSDLRYLASLYSTYYAPAEWKKQLFGFDLLDLKPWLERASRTATDLDFYELMVEYVASLNDTHDRFSLPSDFTATLGFSVDIYDGVVLIEGLNRTQIPAARYPFTTGDELISVDGVETAQLLKDFAKYAAQSNPSAIRRIAASRIPSRSQSVMPHAVDLIGKSATIVVRRQNGALESYTIPWVTSGTPLQVGPVPAPRAVSKLMPRAEASEPDYMAELRSAQWSGVLHSEDTGVSGYGSRNPIFLNALPQFGFTRRLGGATTDFYYSGTFKFEELTIGYIRIPNYSPPSSATALLQFEQEMAFMTANTDGLIVDEMRNTGGLLCFGEEIAARLIPYQFVATGFQLRPYWSRINSFNNSLVSAKNSNASQTVVSQYELMLNSMLSANREGRTVTESLPLCTSSLVREPLLDRNGNRLAYAKPLMMLIDEFSTSTADSVPGMIADARRGPLYGMRTNGAGGNNTSFHAGAYTEGTTGMTLALQARKAKVGGFGFPYSEYIENAGVWPDIPDDYMTRANLLQSGAPFVSGFLQHMAAEIRAKK